MKSNELRIGNVVIDNYSGDLVIINKISCGIIPGFKIINNLQWNYIPAEIGMMKVKMHELNENWEEVDGVIRLSEHALYLVKDKVLNVNNELHQDDISYQTNGYFHEIQNLHFILTGEDLQINNLKND